MFLPVEGAKTTRPFTNCSMDLITDLPPAAGYDSILVVVDQGLSKGVILLPCNKMITSEGTAKLLSENLYKRFGLPDKIISDRGPQFASKAFLELLKLLGIGAVNCLSPTDRRYYGTCQPRNRSIPVNLLCLASGRMAPSATHPGVYSQ